MTRRGTRIMRLSPKEAALWEDDPGLRAFKKAIAYAIQADCHVDVEILHPDGRVLWARRSREVL